MKKTKLKILQTKTVMYLLLILLTGIIAFMSFSFYNDDLEERLHPQIVRALIQVSKILPQLEENEQAIRDINDDLEKKRQNFLNENEEDLEDIDDPGETEEDVETVINNTLSWMNRITKLRVGREGHVMVISQDDYTILAHPEDKYVGQMLYLVDNEDFDIEAIPDLGEIGGRLSKDDIPEELHLFIPVSVYDMDIDQLFDALEAGIIGSVFAYKDTYILCGVTLREGLIYVVIRTFFTTLFFFLIGWVLVRYSGFALLWHKDGKTVFRRKLVSYCIIGTVVLFFFTWYYQTIMDVTGDLATMNEHAKVAVETLNTYQKYREELSDWLDQKYLDQCRLAAELIKARGVDNLTRQELDDIAKDLKVEYIYVFDKNGKVVVTNSPYDHFTISNNKEDQSYAFRPLLDGREYVIQDVQKDETSGERKQYIGVSLRDENDLADGFVQIAIRPTLRDRMLNPINVQTVLDNLVIGLPDYAMAVDKDSMEIVATTGLGYRNKSIEELGFNLEDIESGFNGYCVIGGNSYYLGVSESEDLYLMPLVRSTENTNSLKIALKITLISLIAYLFIALIAFFGYGKILVTAESEAAKEEKTVSMEDKKRGRFRPLKHIIRLEEKNDSGFEKRWRKQSAIPIEDQTPEMRVSGIIYRLLLVLSVSLIFFELSLITIGVSERSLDGFSYVLLGNWEKGVNLFSFSYCLFLLCVLYVFQELINQVLYRIARISDLKRETIFLLLRNALKYACAVVFLYIGLAKFGVDTKALWASAGVLSLMIGFGAKDLVNDIIAGLFIIFEGTIKIGDFITVGDWCGNVEEIGIRSTRVVYDRDTKIFNNSSLRDIINSDEVSLGFLDIPVSYDMDLMEIEKLLKKELPLIDSRIPEILEPTGYSWVNSFEDSCVMLRFAVYTAPAVRKRVFRVLRREIKVLFDREHISIPFNHVVVKNYDEMEGTYIFTAGEEAKEKEQDETDIP
jgi:small conductance mechanosensitive channel